MKHKRIITTVLKMSLAGLVTSLIAKALRLDYWITAGILAVLSTQMTKKDSFNVAVKRISDSILGLFLSTAMFIVLGYNYWVFSVFVLVFASLSFVLKIEVGIVPVLVLVSHLLDFGEFSWAVILNEFAIIGIAIVVVLVIDLIFPSPTQNKFKQHIDEIDDKLREYLLLVSQSLKQEIDAEKPAKHYEESLALFEEIYDEVILLDKDLLFQQGSAYLSYLEMRKVQITHVHHIYKHSLKLLMDHKYLNKIVLFIEELREDICYYDKATSQNEKLEEIKKYYKTTALPQTREEFETRAMLYQMLNELEYFLEAKIAFHNNNPHFGFKKEKNNV